MFIKWSRSLYTNTMCEKKGQHGTLNGGPPNLNWRSILSLLLMHYMAGFPPFGPAPYLHDINKYGSFFCWFSIVKWLTQLSQLCSTVSLTHTNSNFYIESVCVYFCLLLKPTKLNQLVKLTEWIVAATLYLDPVSKPTKLNQLAKLAKWMATSIFTILKMSAHSNYTN